MPELPEVETVRRSLLPHLVGQTIVEVEVHHLQLREAVDVATLRRRLLGQKFVGLRRRSKYLLADLSAASTLMVHLGMSGRLLLGPGARPRARHDHVILRLGDGRALFFNDARRFGLFCCFAAAAEAQHPRLRDLGVEPLSADFSAARLWTQTRGVRQAIKCALMDAKRQVGVGNIYACEALHAAGVHPARAAGRLSEARCGLLVRAVRQVLTDAIELGGTTLRDFLGGEGAPGLFAPRLLAYGRQGQPCRRCQTPIRRIIQAGRSTFYCPGCQR